ncbi:unnamed protein product [Rhizoctonia solani]|uniref:Uncharacterized protein n=1 Tax=Rhizoctonia solani TaxID=456999 RepID=A0A8H2Y3Y4_9AGAM|nr:unnamed protein product [Rhizoctonia solani]
MQNDNPNHGNARAHKVTRANDQEHKVSRQLLAIINASQELQYLLELDHLGFAPPLNSLDTISLGDKIGILHRKRLIATGTTRHEINARTTKLDPIGPPSVNIRVWYSRGALAVGKSSINVTNQVQLYQLASDNKQTEHSSLLLQDTGVEADDFRFDPDLDLLVLLERINTPADADADVELRLHLRSLSTGLAHPLASSPVLRETFKLTTRYNETGFQIVGKLIVILCFRNSHSEMALPRMCVWNWITGELITSTKVSGKYFAFISEDIFLIPVGHLRSTGSDTIGSLLVFSIADVHFGGPARLVASLRLPLPATAPCYCQYYFIPAPPPPTPLVINGHHRITTPKRVYEIGSHSHYLCLRVKAYKVGAPNETAKGLLFFQTSNIQAILSKVMASQPNCVVHIPWEDWARGTSWINTWQMYYSLNCVFGHRVALLSFDHNKCGWRALVYDLQANVRGLAAVEPYKDNPEELSDLDAYLNGVFFNPNKNIPRARVVTSIMVSEGEDFDDPTDLVPPMLAIDDERIITYDRTELAASPKLHVYDI